MPSVLAIFAHPDDIEFVAAGTMLRLGDLGWDLHYHTVANGECGSMETGPAETAEIRETESREAAAILGASYHPPIGRDISVFYNEALLCRLCAVVRRAAPDIVLTHALSDYMEDHMITARLAVTATFSKGMPNYASDPPEDPVAGDVVLYHAMPHGGLGPLREAVEVDLFIDTTAVHEWKLRALAAHASQKAWLDATQGMDSYLATCDEGSRTAAERSGLGCEHAEGWRRHLHVGFSAEEIDPLAELLG